MFTCFLVLLVDFVVLFFCESFIVFGVIDAAYATAFSFFWCCCLVQDLDFSFYVFTLFVFVFFLCFCGRIFTMFWRWILQCRWRYIFCAWIMLARSLCFCCFASAGFCVVRFVYPTEFVDCFVCCFFVTDMIVTLAIV